MIISMNEALVSIDKLTQQIAESNYISRDLSWLQFNYRVLDQSRHIDRTIFDRLRFLSITASNLDEFCTIRLGSLYNYIDYGKERNDYSGLREEPFRQLLLAEIKNFVQAQHAQYVNNLRPAFTANGFDIRSYKSLTPDETSRVDEYFKNTVYPMLTPMLFDSYHA